MDMKFKLLTVFLLLLLVVSCGGGSSSNQSNNAEPDATIDEGIEYKLMSPALPTITKNKIEVIEIFWYGCSHCYNFEPHLNTWLAKKPKNVVFYRIPAVFNSAWATHARVFYTAKSLGLFDNGKLEFHEAFFDVIHKGKKRMLSKKSIQRFFIRFGVSEEDFNNTYESFAINIKVTRATTLSKRYQTEGVPTIIVNGKYRTDGPMAGGSQGIIKILDFLIKKSE